MTFLLIIMTYPSSLVSQFFVKSHFALKVNFLKNFCKFKLSVYGAKKNLIYLCMNAIFSKTMQDTETKISLFL